MPTRLASRQSGGNTQRVEEIDLLSDELVVKKQVVKQDARFRSVDKNSAYRAIEEAYQELKEQLETAAGVSV